MRIFGIRPRLLALDMFDDVAARTREEAARARRLEGLYHIGQEKIWDGRKVLADLRAKHGPIVMPEDKRRALSKIFSIIMWGELAAWKVSAQLAARIVPLEAKMAATSQAHDEARHFYVMHDYLQLLGLEPPPLEFWSRTVVELAIGTEDLAQKLAGMQLQVETIALTIFQKVRELRVEPVLSELLLYIERDEARHVGLGVQYLPELLKKMSVVEHARFTAFQLKMLLASIAGLRRVEQDFAALGVDARELIQFGAQKQLTFLNDLARESGTPMMQGWASRIFDVVAEAAFPASQPQGGLRGVYDRARSALDVALRRTEGLGEPWRRAQEASLVAV